jgi:hypothetical protein
LALELDKSDAEGSGRGLPANSFGALSVWTEPGPLWARAARGDCARRGGGHQKPSPLDIRSIHHFAPSQSSIQLAEGRFAAIKSAFASAPFRT